MKRKEEQYAERFKKIEKEANKEPTVMYAKNNLLLEKIILERALNKAQKRRFIKKNI